MAQIRTPEAGRLTAFPDSGYFVLRQAAGTLLADFGAPGASPNPGHQHAGIFSFEISSGERRVVVDTGAPTYDPGPERDGLRGTAAHNTIRIDREDQYEVWKAFRVGRSARVTDLRWKEEGDIAVVRGAHDGYRRFGIRHERRIFSLAEAGWLICDFLHGAGEHEVESFLGLGPGLEAGGEPRRMRLEPIGWSLITIDGPGFEIGQGVCAQRIGERTARTRLRMAAKIALPARWIYWICPRAMEQLAWRRDGTGDLDLAAGDVRHAVTLDL